jgi:hypothetical protein
MTIVARRKALLSSGRTRRSFYKRTKYLRPVRTGIYAVRSSADEPFEPWQIEIRAQLLQSGPEALVGLRSAARLHQLDGFRESTAIETIVSHTHHTFNGRPKGVSRTRTLSPNDLIVIDGLPTTTKARTLIDLGRVVDDALVEYALESALRGPDVKNPWEWDQGLLVELQERTLRVYPRTGAEVLRTVLLRRPEGVVPTGSYAETTMVQTFRTVGLGSISRQCLVRFFDPNGELIRWFYIDFMVIKRLFGIEVNGAGPRNGASMTASDLARLNLLTRILRMHIVPAVDANKFKVASEIRALVEAEPVRQFPIEVRGYRLFETANGIDAHALR